MHGLWPPVLDVLGLNSALEERRNDCARRVGIAADYTDAALPHVPSPVAIFFCVMQEILNNVANHAHAPGIQVQLDQDKNAFRLQIENNGCGFDAAAYQANHLKPVGIGSVGMCGRLKMVKDIFVIDSAVGKGTRLLPRVPKHTGPKTDGGMMDSVYVGTPSRFEYSNFDLTHHARYAILRFVRGGVV